MKKIYLSLAAAAIVTGFSMNTAAQNPGTGIRAGQMNRSGAADSPIGPRRGNGKRIGKAAPQQVSGNFIGVDVWEHAIRNDQVNQNKVRTSDRSLISVSVDPTTDTPERINADRASGGIKQENNRTRENKPAVFEPNDEPLWSKRKRAGLRRNIPVETDFSKW